MADDYVDAPYAVDEKKDAGWIHIIMKVKGLKVKSEGGFLSKTKVATNATIEKPEFSERSLLVMVNGTKDSLKGTKFKLEVRKLPYDIEPSSCYIQPEENRIVVYLKKSNSEQSWKRNIEGSGIETDD